MKNFYPKILFLLSLSLMSCEKSYEQKAKDAIHTYLNENLNDVSSYEAVKFGKLDSISDLYVGNSRYSHWKFQMFHSYRILTFSGQKIIIKEYFIFNSKWEVVAVNPYDK